VCWNPVRVSCTNGVVLAIPSRYSVRPLGAVSNVRLTLRGKMVTVFVEVSPVASRTVSVIR
jgi:hypothetical protein